jgi:hypothetical protein
LLTAVKPGKVTVPAAIAMPSGSLTGSSVVTIVPATSATASRGTMQDAPLFTTLPIPLICAESSFVAIASLSHPEQLIVIRIGPGGIEEPHTIPLESDVYGMKCNYQRVELLVEGQNEDFFSRLPFTIREDSIERKKPIPIEYSISQKGPTPVEIEDFHKTQAVQRGDWFVQIPGYQRHNTTYELHFVSTVERSSDAVKSKLVIDLLEETLDSTVTKTVSLVRIETSEGGE